MSKLGASRPAVAPEDDGKVSLTTSTHTMRKLQSGDTHAVTQSAWRAARATINAAWPGRPTSADKPHAEGESEGAARRRRHVSAGGASGGADGGGTTNNRKLNLHDHLNLSTLKRLRHFFFRPADPEALAAAAEGTGPAVEEDLGLDFDSFCEVFGEVLGKRAVPSRRELEKMFWCVRRRSRPVGGCWRAERGR